MIRVGMIRVGPHVVRVSPLALALLGAAGLASLAAALWPVDAGAPAAGPGAPPLDLGRLAAGETGAAVRQPLFDPERRAWTALGSREDLTAEPPTPTLLSVRGILIETRVRRALVADGAGAPAWLTPGEGRGAWRLVSIEADRVVVADSARHYTLAFLGPAVALRPAPRYPTPEEPTLRPALSPPEGAARVGRTEPMTAPPPPDGPASPRRIEIARPGAP